MKHIKLFDNYIFENSKNNLLFTILFNQIEQKVFMPITDKIFNNIDEDGYTEEVNNYEGDYEQLNFEYIELDFDDKYKQGLINSDDDIVELFNDFDIELKEKYGDILDYIDYDTGTVIIIKHTKRYSKR